MRERCPALGRRSLSVQREQAPQHLVVVQVDRPTVGGDDRFIQGAMGIRQPRRALVVEVGQGAGGIGNGLSMQVVDVGAGGDVRGGPGCLNRI